MSNKGEWQQLLERVCVWQRAGNGSSVYVYAAEGPEGRENNVGRDKQHLNSRKTKGVMQCVEWCF